jgi:O-antigen/teichoic acid export membrane protein
MSKEKKLMKNTLIYLMGNMGSKLMIFLLLPLYTNYLQKSEYGYYDILLTIAMLVESIFTLRIPDAMYRWLLDKKEDENFIISTCVDLLKKLILIFSFTYLLFYRWLNEGFVMV